VIYLDHAATAGRRPPEVGEAMVHALEEVAANPGRSGHRLALAAARVVEGARRAIAELIHAPDPANVVLTANATAGINTVLAGTLAPGDVVLHSAWEHNAVMRPLHHLEATRGVQLEPIQVLPDAAVDLDWLARRLAAEPVRLVCMLLASNVTGEAMPVAQVGMLCRQHGAWLLVDGAQGLGVLDLDVVRDHVDALAITGHKSLYGPPGTGALYLRDPEPVAPLIHGGTGSRSEEEVQPGFLPDRFEAGTGNAPGLAGLAAGIRAVQAQGLPAIRDHLRGLHDTLAAGLAELPGVTVHGPRDAARRTSIVSCTVASHTTSEVARALDEQGILTRPGLHCAPRAHRTLGTLPQGTIRFSLATFTTHDDVTAALRGFERAIAR
jgi:cysteine desulfurase family protein